MLEEIGDEGMKMRKILNKIKEMLAELGLPSVADKLDFRRFCLLHLMAMALGSRWGETC